MGLQNNLQNTSWNVAIPTHLWEDLHLPVKLEFKAHWAIKRWNMDFEAAEKKRKIQLFELEE